MIDVISGKLCIMWVVNIILLIVFLILIKKKKDNYLKYLFIMIDSKDEYLIWKYIEWMWGVMW